MPPPPSTVTRPPSSDDPGGAPDPGVRTRAGRPRRPASPSARACSATASANTPFPHVQRRPSWKNPAWRTLRCRPSAGEPSRSLGRPREPQRALQDRQGSSTTAPPRRRPRRSRLRPRPPALGPRGCRQRTDRHAGPTAADPPRDGTRGRGPSSQRIFSKPPPGRASAARVARPRRCGSHTPLRMSARRSATNVISAEAGDGALPGRRLRLEADPKRSVVVPVLTGEREVADEPPHAAVERGVEGKGLAKPRYAQPDVALIGRERVAVV